MKQQRNGIFLCPYVRYNDTGAIVLDAKNVSTDRYFRCIRDLD